MIPRRKAVRSLMLHRDDGERVRGHSVHVDCWLFPFFLFAAHFFCRLGDRLLHSERVEQETWANVVSQTHSQEGLQSQA